MACRISSCLRSISRCDVRDQGISHENTKSRNPYWSSFRVFVISWLFRNFNDWALSEADALRLGAEPRDDNGADEHYGYQTAHRLPVGEFLAEGRFDVRDARRAEHAELIGEPREESPQLAGGELVDVRRNHTP